MFIENLQIQIYTFIGIHMHRLHGNSTLKTLINRAYMISSNDSYLKLELKYLRKVLHEQNGYPHWFITKVLNKVKRINIPRKHFQIENKNENGVTSKQTPILPYVGEKGCSIVRF